MKDRQSSRTAEQAVKDAEAMISNIKSLEEVEAVFSKVAEGMHIHEVKVEFFSEGGILGVRPKTEDSASISSIKWKDPVQKGYYSRDKEFIAEFSISGRNYSYGIARYTFMDGRSNLEVQEEVLLERVHDALSSLAAKLRKAETK